MYTSYSGYRTPEYVRTYRTILQDLSKRRILPRIPSKSQIYTPPSTFTSQEANQIFVPLFYAGEKGAMGIWEKEVSIGFVKRRLDEEDRSYHTLEISNPRNSLGTFISAPKSVVHALHITLPHFVMVMKNYRRNFAFEILIMDSNAYRRRFSFATWYNPALLKKYSFLCQVPLRLEIGWNEIHVNLSELVTNAYRTSYVETLRIRVYANCKLRQIFFCDNRIILGDIPVPSMRDFSNIRLVPLEVGPRMHPDAIESGPEKLRQYPYNEPPLNVPPTRLEKDLQVITKKRFLDVSKLRLTLQPYKTYFREHILEDKHKKKVAEKVQTALRAELAKKTLVEVSANTPDDASSSILQGGSLSSQNEGPPILSSTVVSIPESSGAEEKETESLKAIAEEKPVVAEEKSDESTKKLAPETDINKNTEAKVSPPPATATNKSLANKASSPSPPSIIKNTSTENKGPSPPPPSITKNTTTDNKGSSPPPAPPPSAAKNTTTENKGSSPPPAPPPSAAKNTTTENKGSSPPPAPPPSAAKNTTTENKGPSPPPPSAGNNNKITINKPSTPARTTTLKNTMNKATSPLPLILTNKNTAIKVSSPPSSAPGRREIQSKSDSKSSMKNKKH